MRPECFLLPRNAPSAILRVMENSKLLTGVVKTPQSVPGTMRRFEAEVEMKDLPGRRLAWDSKSRLATVYDEKGEILGSTERQSDGSRQVILANGIPCPVAFKDSWFSSSVWIENSKYKSVMSLEGSTRVFGNDRLRLEHRDFKSEVRFRCVPELEVAAIIVAFEVYWSKNATNDAKSDIAGSHSLILLFFVVLSLSGKFSAWPNGPFQNQERKSREICNGSP
jgi:hypothetical protein